MRKPIALLVLLILLASLPSTAAQGSTPPALGILWDDSFDVQRGWTAVGTATNNWRRIIDQAHPDGDLDRRVWFASRLSGGQPDGYGNGANTVLTSPAIPIPAGISVRSLVPVVRGSSEAGADLLELQWAPGEPAFATDFETIRTWSGKGDEASYTAAEYTSAKLLAAQGSITVRFRFTSDATCDSDPGTPSANLGGDNGVRRGEVEDQFNCPDDGVPGSPLTYSGWFVDRLTIIGRRDFVESAGPGAEHVVVDASDPDAMVVDLIGDRGDLLEFRVDEANLNGPYDTAIVRLTRAGSSEVLVASMVRSGTVWSGLLAVDEPDLVTGTWTARYFGIKDGSGQLLGSRTLDVRASDITPPRILVAPTGSPVLLGAGDSLEVTVLETLLREVTYTFEGLPMPVAMHEPFSLRETALPEGRSNVTFTATDRAGHTGTVRVAVDRDTVAPIIDLQAPDTVYADVPFTLGLNVTERSGHTLHLDANGTLQEFTIPAGTASSGAVTLLQLTAPDLGLFTVELRAVDEAGNEATVLRQFNVVQAVTDLRVSAVTLGSPATNVQREGQTIVATLQQVVGVAPLPVTVTFTSGAHTATFNVTVPANGNLDVSWNATLPAGQRLVQVTAVAPPAANETAPGDESGSLAVDVYVGRITIGPQVYNIRADSRGLPVVAVLAGSSKTYPLSLVDSDKGVAYRFTADGNRTVIWDPLQPVQVVPLSSATGDGDGKDTPFPGLLLVLLVVALAAMAQRRARNGR